MKTISRILVDGAPVEKHALRTYLEQREIPTVLDFGADASGQTDSSSAIQAAIDATAGGTLVVPDGRYRLEHELVYRAPGTAGDNVPGLQLIGAGSGVTMFDCRMTKGAALRVDQSVGYSFSRGGSVSGIEFVGGGADAPEQDAIYLSGAWQYRFTDLILRDFGRHGITCPYRSDLGYRLDGVAIETGSDRLVRAGGGFLTRLRPRDLLSGPGIPSGSTVAEVLGDSTIRISAPVDRTATVDITFGGNTDAFQSIVQLDRCNIRGNGGWGIDGSAGLGLLLAWSDTAVQECGQGGVMVGGGTRLTRGIIAANGHAGGPDAAGLRLIKAPGTPQLIHVENIEFDSNQVTQLWVNYAANARFYQCRFISHVYRNQGMVPPIGVLIGGRDPLPGNAQNVEFDQCAWRADPQDDVPYQGIAFGTKGSYRNVLFRDPLWITLTAPNQVRYGAEPHPDAFVRMEESGLVTLAPTSSRPILMQRKLQPQTVPPNAATVISFDSVIQARGFVGMVVPLSHAYAVELSLAVDGLTAGEGVVLAVMADDVVLRQVFLVASGLKRQSFGFDCILALRVGQKIGARITISGQTARVITGDPSTGGFTIVALT